jgi:YggT family protein
MTRLLITAITLYEGLILLRVVLSWFAAPNRDNPALELLRKLTDPLLAPVQDALPETGGVDLSPLIVLIGLELLKRLLS